MSPSTFEPLFHAVEQAIDTHPQLQRERRGTAKYVWIAEPLLSVDRSGFQVEISVKLLGSRKKPTVISGKGDTAEEAVDNLIDMLDYWVQAIR